MTSKEDKLDPNLLGITKDGDQFVLTYDGEPIKTKGGNLATHKSDHLFKMIISEAHQINLNPPRQIKLISEDTKKFVENYISNHPVDLPHKKDYPVWRLGSLFWSYNLQKDKIEQGQDIEYWNVMGRTKIMRIKTS